MGADDALTLARRAKQVVVAKGKKVTRFETKSALKKPDELAAAMLGPTGNLRAPTILSGKTLLVGFNEEAYAEQFGG
jgi:arsenate reductase-like glutaredoxin family protein